VMPEEETFMPRRISVNVSGVSTAQLNLKGESRPVNCS